MSNIGRNDPCTCGSGKKFKKCCIDKVAASKALNPLDGPTQDGKAKEYEQALQDRDCERWIAYNALNLDALPGEPIAQMLVERKLIEQLPDKTWQYVQDVQDKYTELKEKSFAWNIVPPPVWNRTQYQARTAALAVLAMGCF